MKILAFNPGHDGAVAYVRDGILKFSIEAEKDSNYRYSPVSSHDVLRCLGEFDEVPEVICTGGWWPRELPTLGMPRHADYRGLGAEAIFSSRTRLLGRDVISFSSSHERSHLLCAFGMSKLPKGTPCYALIWEGAIGAFYEVDQNLNISLIADVLNEPGNRYTSIYGLADPTFPKDAPFSRFSDAGKLMALASFSTRSNLIDGERELIDFLLSAPHVQLNLYDALESSPYYNVGLEDREFRNFAGIFSDAIFDIFADFARRNLTKGLPLLIAGGCGLNCDWNTKWRETGIFSDVFVPPVANDSGSAIGTAIDAQFQLIGDPKISWDVYSGLEFAQTGIADLDEFEALDASDTLVADMLANELILAWVNGRYEIGPRALGNRSILAAPFRDETRIRLNEIKQREQFRPIAPVCLEQDAATWFGCNRPSPHMLFTFQVKTDRLLAVTHVNGTARLQTVSQSSNKQLYSLLRAFKEQTGFGVLCNTSLNFNGRGFINNLADLSRYVSQHCLDGFVVGGRAYLRRSSERYQTYANNRDYLASGASGEARGKSSTRPHV